jgi:hypothetical protein
MKTLLPYLCLLLSFIGCQKSYSDDVILGYLDLNQALEESNSLILNTNKTLLGDIKATSRTKIQYKPLLEKAQAFFEAGQVLDEWITDLKDNLIKKTGGYYTKKEALEAQQPLLEKTLKGANNNDIVEAFLLSIEFKDKPHTPQANVLDEKIQTLQENYATLLKSCWLKVPNSLPGENGGIQNTIFLDKSKEDSIFTLLNNALVRRSSKDYNSSANNALTWAQFHFQNQPLAAVLLSLTSIQNNIKTSENSFLSFLATQTTYGDLVYDKFFIYAQTAKPNIQLGDTYEAEIGLGTYASKAQMEVVIEGDTLNTVDGIVHYNTRPRKIGEHRYTAQVIITNPLTGATETFKREFSFEVIP